jgi:hypothetical protein
VREKSDLLVSVGTRPSVVWCLSLAAGNGPRERIGERVNNPRLLPPDTTAKGAGDPALGGFGVCLLSRGATQTKPP